MYKFAPANRQESIVFGAAKPKYTQMIVAMPSIKNPPRG
jgi:hypothetical protein